ncbi:MAG TPA: M20 family metallopeptidase [Acidimicrobiales bacterium]|nr:M20 family metallopeptidase [Acidimicrobiales bacterium]
MTPGQTEETKARAGAAVERNLSDLLALSHAIHAAPELSFAEDRAARRTADVLRAGGFAVTQGVADLPTAFSARAGSGPLVVALCAEYDALPEVGHACGHNMIAASSVGAGLALAQVADEAGLTVLVLGTPAEEGGGGKVLMLDRGVFDEAHLAMMVHPWPSDRVTAHCLAVSHFDVHYRGKEAHAAAAPWRGINAADAMTIAQVAIGLLRQHLNPGDLVHGVVLEAGSAPNVVPASATGRFMCRARTLEDLAVLEPRVKRCFEAGALATGAAISYEVLCPPYSHMEPDRELLALYRTNAESLGRNFDLDDTEPPPAVSTDMANVSLVVPTIHPLIGIETHGAVNHQAEFTAACITPSADRAVRDGALALAWTAIDAAATPAVRDRLLARRAS